MSYMRPIVFITATLELIGLGNEQISVSGEAQPCSPEHLSSQSQHLRACVSFMLG